jgi:hypothetical protein
MCRNFRSIEWHQKHTTKSHNTVHFRFSICLQWARLNYFEGIDILEYFYPILQYRCLPIFYSKKLFLRQSAYLLCCKLSLKINQTVYILPLILMIISRWSPYTSDLVNNYFTDNTEKVWGLVFGFCWEIYQVRSVTELVGLSLYNNLQQCKLKQAVERSSRVRTSVPPKWLSWRRAFDTH